MISLALAVTLVGIAAIDSLNPSLFLAQFYLFSTPRPLPRVLAYVAGILVVNFLGGVLLLLGVQAVLARWLGSAPPAWLIAGEILLGMAALLFGIFYKGGSKAGGQDFAEIRKPRSLSPVSTFFLGGLVMVNELTTALPYFLATEQIARANLSPAAQMGALLLYNFIFALPLLAFVVGYSLFQQRFAEQAAAINRGIAVWTPRLLKWVSMIFGVALLADGLWRAFR